MTEGLVKKAQAAVERGDMGGAVAAKKALGHEIVNKGLQGDTGLVADFHRIHEDIGRLNEQAKKNPGATK